MRTTSGAAALLLLLALPAAPRAQAPAAPPAAPPTAEAMASSPALRRAREVAAVLNGGDFAAMQALVREGYAPAFRDRAPVEHVEALAQTADLTRGVEEARVTEATPTAARILTRNRLTGGYLAIRVTVEPEAPHRITDVALRPAAAPAGTAPRAPVASDEAMAAELDAFAKRLGDADNFSGTVLLARDGRTIFQGAYGLASREYGAANRVDTKISLGSINKMFTTVAILRLVEQGRLRLDDAVATHLPGVLRDDVARRVTLRQLLTHTSGLDDFLFTPEMYPLSRARFRTLADYAPRLADDTLQFAPGTDWSYSNTGFLVLGLLLEKVTGEDYHAHVRRTIFAPLGMADTDAYELDRVVPNLATGYDREYGPGGPGWRNTWYEQVARGTSAGGGFSTVGDLLKFAEALRTNRLLSPETTRLMLSAKPDEKSPQYGFGTQVFTPDGRIVGHTGGGPGTASSVEIHLDTGYVVIALSNMNRGGVGVTRYARELVAAREAARGGAR